MKFGSKQADQVGLAKRWMVRQAVVNLVLILGWLGLLFFLFADQIDPSSKTGVLVELGLVGLGWVVVLGVGQWLSVDMAKISVAMGVEGIVVLLMVLEMGLSGFSIVSAANGLLALGLIGILFSARKEIGRPGPLAVVGEAEKPSAN